MILSENQNKRSTKFYMFLRKQPECFLKEHDIVKCKKCNGRGIDCFESSDGNISWDCMNYCDECKGVGYKGYETLIKLNETQYICKECGFIGCEKCNYTGTVDWVTNLMQGGEV